MDIGQKPAIAIAAVALLFAAYAAVPIKALADDIPPLAAPAAPTSTYATGYTEKYTFKINGRSIGTQTATLAKVVNGVQTWSFVIDLLVPINTQTISLKQSGTFTLASDSAPLAFNSLTITNGAQQTENIAFDNNSANVDFVPAIPAITPNIPILGRPNLLVNNLVTLISLATQANFAKQSKGYSVSAFSANALRQVFLDVKPSFDPQTTGAPYQVFDFDISAPGLPDSTSQLWLSTTTGEVIRSIDKDQNLEISKD